MYMFNNVPTYLITFDIRYLLFHLVYFLCIFVNKCEVFIFRNINVVFSHFIAAIALIYRIILYTVLWHVSSLLKQLKFIRFLLLEDNKS